MSRKLLFSVVALMVVLPTSAERPSEPFDLGSVKQRVQGPDARTVFVNCAEGQRIGKALQHPAKSLIVEVRGICEENVEIWRNNVTLRGADPMLDGIRGVATDPLPYATVEVWYADTVRLENLTLSEGPSYGFGGWYSQVELDNVRLIDNAGFGIHMSSTTFLVANELTFIGNLGGVRVNRNASFSCEDCVFEDNQEWAIRTVRAEAYIVNGRISGPLGAYSSDGGGTVIYYTAIDVESLAAQAADSSMVTLLDLEVAGSFRSSNRGSVRLFGVTQTSSPIGNMVADHGTFEAWNSMTPTTLVGPFDVARFGQAVLKGTTALNGNLACYEAGDAYADDPMLITGTVTGCEHCSHP